MLCLFWELYETDQCSVWSKCRFFYVESRTLRLATTMHWHWNTHSATFKRRCINRRREVVRTVQWMNESGSACAFFRWFKSCRDVIRVCWGLTRNGLSWDWRCSQVVWPAVHSHYVTVMVRSCEMCKVSEQYWMFVWKHIVLKVFKAEWYLCTSCFSWATAFCVILKQH
jgi:hypothetical protein